MTTKLIIDLVGKLDALIEQSAELPAIGHLAEKWHVSYLTMSKAVHILTARGKIECIAGRRIRTVSRSDKNSRATVPPSVNAFLTALRGRILDGSLRSGEALPKLAYYAATEHVSKNTVARSLRHLDKEHLVHKRGRQWVAGPARRLRTPTLHEQPAILLVAPYIGTFRGLFEHGFNARFMIPFGEELTRAGIRQHFVQMYSAEPDPQIRRKALEDAGALVRRLGSRYLGAFVHRGPYRFEEYCESTDAWISFLGELRRPVVYFDSNGMNEAFSRSRYPLLHSYYRLYFDEKAAVRRALQTLVAAGHRRIGFPVPSEEPSEWISLRAKMTEAVAAERAPSPAIFTVRQKEGIWRAPEQDIRDTMYERIAALPQAKRTAASEYRSRRQALLESTPSFRELFAAQVTAIMAPNDSFAMAYQQWIEEAGIEIPRHLSMISFDNTPEAAPLPISTIDFGFGRLGYLAAHLLLGDLPVKAGRDGNLAGACTYVDRGSVGTPREGTLGL